MEGEGGKEVRRQIGFLFFFFCLPLGKSEGRRGIRDDHKTEGEGVREEGDGDAVLATKNEEKAKSEKSRLERSSTFSPPSAPISRQATSKQKQTTDTSQMMMTTATTTKTATMAATKAAQSAAA